MPVRSIAVSSDQQFIAAVNNLGNCYIWKLDGPDVFAYKKMEVHKPNYALKCKFSPDCTLVAQRKKRMNIGSEEGRNE